MLLGLEDHGVCWVLWDFHPVCAIACIPGSDDVDIPLPPPSPPPPPPHPSPPLPPPASGLYYLLLLQLKLAPFPPYCPSISTDSTILPVKGREAGTGEEAGPGGEDPGGRRDTIGRNCCQLY